jgi:hypothetical protein
MTDGQLLKVAEDLDSLTDQAKEGLNAELRRRGLEEATVPPLPVRAEAAGPETPELRQLKETCGQMTDAEILRLATEMDSFPDQTVDVLYSEVCGRKLDEAIAGEAPEVPPPSEAEDLVPLSRDTDLLGVMWACKQCGTLTSEPDSYAQEVLPRGSFRFPGLFAHLSPPVRQGPCDDKGSGRSQEFGDFLP